MLEARSLSLSRGGALLWRDLSFVLGSGEILEIRGSNGVGKTSLLRVMTGLTPPNSGEVFWRKEPIKDDIDDYRNAMSYVGHQSALRGELSACENLLFSSNLKNQAVDESDVRQIAGVLAVENFLDKPCGSLSEGQRKRVALSRLLLERALLWILDEPLSALDEDGARRLTGMIEQHLAGGGAALVAAHVAIPVAGKKSRSLVLPDRKSSAS